MEHTQFVFKWQLKLILKRRVTLPREEEEKNTGKSSQTDDDTQELPDHEEVATLKALDDIKNKLESLLLLKPALEDLKSEIAKLTAENKKLAESLNSKTKEIQEIKNAPVATEKVIASLTKESNDLKVKVDKFVESSLFRATCALVVVCLVSRYSRLIYMLSTHSDNQLCIPYRLAFYAFCFRKELPNYTI